MSDHPYHILKSVYLGAGDGEDWYACQRPGCNYQTRFVDPPKLCPFATGRTIIARDLANMFTAASIEARDEPGDGRYLLDLNKVLEIVKGLVEQPQSQTDKQAQEIIGTLKAMHNIIASQANRITKIEEALTTSEIKEGFTKEKAAHAFVALASYVQRGALARAMEYVDRNPVAHEILSWAGNRSPIESKEQPK